jgi:hypothetical protein
MEEGPMAVSLLLALLDIPDMATLNDAVWRAAQPPDSLARKYSELNPHQRMRAMEALYEAFYSILEGQRIDYGGGNADQASKAVGEALARLLTDDPPMGRTLAQQQNSRSLQDILETSLDQAIEDWR